MSYKVKITGDFSREVKRIAKKHKSIKGDLLKLIEDLEQNPLIGTNLGQGLYKVRLSITGTNKGKSGGARVITVVLLLDKVVFLAGIYLKSETSTVDINRIVERLHQQGLLIK